ncbi:hypothetical protein CEXT_237581 [Caerostris extrusa]|uniref:Uncharacterized protein n=1 Tax=Caerostris extrusa TaxID=172846 RepID=A0AAV4Y5N9_CAEEX|nr:hypothetical protein CEXT_237581 [Caerostris extrusa]
MRGADKGGEQRGGNRLPFTGFDFAWRMSPKIGRALKVVHRDDHVEATGAIVWNADDFFFLFQFSNQCLSFFMYLSHRTFSVKVNKTLSSIKNIMAGTPQGGAETVGDGAVGEKSSGSVPLTFDVRLTALLFRSY